MTRHNKEFKEQAIKLSDEIGVKKAAEQLGLLYGTLCEWRKIRKKSEMAIAPDDLSPLTEREKKLLKENKELKVQMIS